MHTVWHGNTLWCVRTTYLNIRGCDGCISSSAYVQLSTISVQQSDSLCLCGCCWLLWYGTISNLSSTGMFDPQEARQEPTIVGTVGNIRRQYLPKMHGLMRTSLNALHYATDFRFHNTNFTGYCHFLSSYLSLWNWSPPPLKYMEIGFWW